MISSIISLTDIGQFVNPIDNLSNYSYIVNMIKRQITKSILADYKQYPIISIIGPRQSGKTTLAKMIFPEKPYMNLENPDIREYAINDPRGFLSEYPNGLILDEVQRAPLLFSYLQNIVDNDDRPGKYILTGSQNFLMMEKSTQSLAGRVSIFKLLPFSLIELNHNTSMSNKVEDYMFKGFYPKLYDQQIPITRYYQNYIQTYIERDVRLIKNITNLNTFQRFIKMCAARNGQLLNLSSLADDCGITHNTARAWISLLETSFIIHLLRPHYKNFNKRLVKMPKIYFYDTGLLCALLNIENKNQLKTHHLKGHLFESFIISEFIKYRYNTGYEPNFYFWRDKHGREIDMIVDKADRLIPIEIKAGETITNDYFEGIRYFNQLSNNDPSNSYVIYSGVECQKRSYSQIFGWKYLTSKLNKILTN